jgi:hypothetical protein
MTGPKITTSALCCECGNLRTCSAHCLMDRELKCAACKTTTMHAVIGVPLIEDWREHINTHPGPGLCSELGCEEDRPE